MKVSKRDKETGEKWKVSAARAGRVKRLFSEFKESFESQLLGASSGDDAEEVEKVGKIKLPTQFEQIEKLQKFFFGTVEEFPYTSSVRELQELKQWIEAVAVSFYMLGAVNLFEACYLAEFSHSVRQGVVLELARVNKRFSLMLKVVNECILTEQKLRRFTQDEQNDFLHG